jgi:hypothetical protein
MVERKEKGKEEGRFSENGITGSEDRIDLLPYGLLPALFTMCVSAETDKLHHLNIGFEIYQPIANFMQNSNQERYNKQGSVPQIKLWNTVMLLYLGSPGDLFNL